MKAELQGMEKWVSRNHLPPRKPEQKEVNGLNTCLLVFGAFGGDTKAGDKKAVTSCWYRGGSPRET